MGDKASFVGNGEPGRLPQLSLHCLSAWLIPDSQ